MTSRTGIPGGFALTEIAANIAVATANSSFSLVCNGKPAPHEASDTMFLVPVSCVSGVQNLDPSFWYEILVPELGSCAMGLMSMAADWPVLGLRSRLSLLYPVVT